MFPLSVACVEHLFCNIKLIKTCLRNQIGETTVDSLLRVSTASLTGFNDGKYQYFIDELKDSANEDKAVNMIFCHTVLHLL